MRELQPSVIEPVAAVKSIVIGLNALYIRWGVNAGTETYFTNIVLPWYRQEPDGCRFILYCNRLPPWWEGSRPWFDVVVIPRATGIAFRIACEQFWFPFYLAGKVNVLFSPGYVGSVFFREKQVITVHDGYAWRFPREAGRLRSYYWRLAIPRSIRGKSEVIAVSQSTATDIRSFCKIKASRVHVIHEAGSQLAEAVVDDSALLRLDVLARQYFHCVGVFKEIKNASRILDAFERYTARAVHAKKLVLVGRVEGDFGEVIENRARKIKSVVLAGRLSDSELAAVYRGSAGLIFPSLYEGFGIPILEAQSLDCAVVTSNVSSMLEVAGDAAILVDPLSTEQICGAMLRLDDICERQTLIERGRENVRRFSWSLASKQTLALLTTASRED